MDGCHFSECIVTFQLYDGGIGIHESEVYTPQFLIEDMHVYDETLLEKWSYALHRVYPRFCPDFNRKFVEHIVHAPPKIFKRSQLLIFI